MSNLNLTSNGLFMKTAKVPSLLLACVLQVLPVTRVFLTASPAAGSSFAIVSTWIAGLAALMGAHDAVSGASTSITSSGTATGTNGAAFSYRITTGPDTANTFSAVPLPTGLACNGSTGRITGTPAESGVFSVLLTASDGGRASRTVTKTLTLTILAGGGGTTPPGISSQPASRTVTNGGTATFSVAASGSGTLRYQWRTNGVSVPGATNSSLALSPVTTNHAGGYSVVVTNNYGAVTSSTATLTVLVPPSILTQPAGQTVTAGESASFTVVASGTATLGYRWRKNGSFITGANGATHTLPATVTTDSASYSVVVTNSVGSITSSVATLTVNPAPVAPSIITQPTNQTGTVGGSVALTVLATGTGTLAYQWRHDGNNIAGGTNTSLSLSGLTTNEAGSYVVVVTNSVGSVTSSVAVVTVLPAPIPPEISAQPESVTVAAGSNASLGVTATGTAPLRYQWHKAGVVVAGATNATLAFTPAQIVNTGGYTVIITNAAGSVTSSVATLTVTNVPVPDAIPPTLVIVSPAAAITVTTSGTIDLAGTAADNQGVTAVWIRQNEGPETTASGTTSWSVTATLAAGTNTFNIRATDAAGNSSVTNTRVVVHQVSLPLALTVNGSGVVAGGTNGQLVELGKSLALKAMPRPGNLFSNWVVNGGVSTDAILTVAMSSNLNVVANFVTNPFAILKGVYTGLFYPAGAEPPHEQSGSFTFTVTDKGAYSGKLFLAGGAYPVSGPLDLSLAATKTIVRKGTNDIVLNFQLQGGGDAVSGSVSNAAWIGDLGGHRAAFNAKLNPATNEAGKYTILLSGGEDSSSSPAGDGPVTLDVSTAGAVVLKGTLADGSAIAQKTMLAANGQAPVYVNLYKGKGSIFGWLTVLNNDTNDTPGLLLWTKKETAGGKIYPAGFTNEALALGSRYVVPSKGSAVLIWSNGIVTLGQGNLMLAQTNDVALSSANRFTVALPNTNKLALTLTPASGLVGGSFVHPATLKKSAIKGMVLQKQQLGGGFFLGTNQSGRVTLGE